MMGKSTITMQVKSFQKLLKQIDEIESTGKKVVSSAIRDLSRAAPKLVADEVAQVFNIDKKEIKPGSTKKDKSGNKTAVKQAGKIKITGDTIETFQMVYEGRLLTPVHFGMTPKAPTPGRSYTLKMQVIKGQKKIIGRCKRKRTPGGPYSEQSHNILMGTGAATSEGVSHIPFQRMSKDRTDLKKFTTVSVPEMVESDRVNGQIHSALSERAEERLTHYMQRYLGR